MHQLSLIPFILPVFRIALKETIGCGAIVGGDSGLGSIGELEVGGLFAAADAQHNNGKETDYDCVS